MNILVDTSNDPWVKFSIDKYNVGVVFPILSEICATEGVNDPVEVGSDSILLFTEYGELCCIPWITWEHREKIVSVFTIRVCDAVTL